MRRRCRGYGRSMVAAAVLLAGSAGIGAAEAAAAPDLTITLAGHPATVSPPGGLALFRLTVKNAVGRQTFSDVAAAVALGAGSAFDPALTGATCSNPAGDGVTVVCNLGTLAPGQSTSVDIFAAPPLTVGTVTTSAAITGSSPPDDRRNNTTKPPATTVVVADPDSRVGFFIPGAHALGNDLLTVPTGGSKGLVTAISHEAAEPLCGSTCLFSDDPLRVDFPLQDPVYKAEDPRNPLLLELDMGFLTPPCRGLGGTCDDLRFLDHLGQPGVVPFCTGASGTNAGPAHALPSSPCKYHQFKTVDGRVHFRIALLSNDPTFF
jgi:hypothetical protein